ncbi:hypothetical protein SAMN05216199_0123 [Pedococcus cremeus]|uniref:DUF2332 domain-containing protein n=1 Tax=Pedococcus cremeus TaxID=587636 RepID=A0A1H9XQJ4_9MICO|nr:DUF2332 domain-containing protein [Pedococcus cremeus]SES48438.1 hypothetical protein SAMN05216199_0123 [Pedococcus cremeus]
MDPTPAETAEEYRRFARVQARGSSHAYERLAEAVAASGPVLDLLATLPAAKRQPNLLFGVGRLMGAPVMDPDAFTAWVVEHWHDVRPEVLARSTQTNEAARCATLLPVLAGIPGPLALLEVGASAGLCLYADRYRYEYRHRDDAVTAVGAGPGPGVTLPCRLDNDVPVPDRLPEVVWRAGLDLHPLDVTSGDDLAWLEALVWPEHEERRRRLHAAAEVLRSDPPLLVAGDLVEHLPALAARAPAGATLVVFHSAVLAYAAPEQRRRFAEVVRGLPGHWVANEAPSVLAGLVEPPAEPEPEPGRFLVARDGAPVAWSDPHGQSLFWLHQ